MPTIQEDLEAARTKLQSAAEALSDIVNGPASGDGSTVETDAGTVKSVARAIAEIGDTSNQATKTLDNVANGDFASKAVAAGVGDMLAENNLSDVQDVPAARGNLGLGSAAMLDVATGGTGDLLRADGDGSGLTGLATSDPVAQDWALQALMELDAVQNTLGPSAYGRAVADPFNNQTGINSGASSNAVYSAAGYFGNLAVGSNVAVGATVTASMGNNAGTPANLVDNNTGTSWQGSANDASFVAGSYVQFDLGSVQNLSQLRNYLVPSQDNFANVVIKGSVSTAFAGEEVTLGSGTFTNPGSSEYQDIDLVGSARYVRMISTDGSLTGTFNLANPVMYEVQILDADPAAMTLQSDAGVITAAAAPTEVRVQVDIEAIDECVLTGTPAVVLSASRDGGSTFSTITLEDTTTIAAGGRRIIRGTVDVSGQPSGTDIVVKVVTTDDGILFVHGWTVQADQTLTVA